jgi:cardiolipin synthase
MYGDDECGVRVRDALVRAAQRGVAVSLAIDGFGSAEVEDGFFAPLIEAGGRFHRFQAKWSRRSLIRNHQKLAIADKTRAMIGGFNVEKGYFAPPDRDGWHDLGLIVEGSAVDLLDAWLDELDSWIDDTNAQFRAITRTVKRWNGGSGAVRLLIGGPSRHLSSWAQCVQQDLKQGRRLDMVMAYFSPPMKLLRRIGQIAKRGEARLIMAAKSDNGATIGATRSLYDYLLKKNTRIFEFTPCKLHMKIVVLDDAVYLGSANFDMRSLYINLELMLRIEDKGLADRMREFIAAHEDASNHITLAEHKRQAGLWNRIRWNVSWFLVTVMDYNVSRGLNLGL